MKYIYKYNYEPNEENLVDYEMKSIFGSLQDGDAIITDMCINPNKSYHLNYRLDILCEGKTVDQLLPQIENLKLSYNGFKIEFIDVDSSIMKYEKRINYCITIADLFDGYGQMKDPNITFVVTQVDNVWYFGQLIRNDRSFERLQNKPHTYSHSMSCELSRTVVNIACGQDKPKLVDPCHGIGTVICEAVDLGYDIEGTELNWLVFDKARENLEAVGIDTKIISQGDMHNIAKSYDVSILDIPYGLMSKTTPELQTGLIEKCYQISSKLLLIANENCDSLINNTKWKIIDRIDVPKANYKFIRYVYILGK